MVKLKIILVGPSQIIETLELHHSFFPDGTYVIGRDHHYLYVMFQAGKSTISNFLSEAIDYSSYEYRPTPGVRILEFELNNKNIEVELWDCSGEDRFENLWPVFLWNANGVVIVYNPENAAHILELDRLNEHFIVKSMIPHTNALLVANCKDPNHKPSSPEFSGTLASITHLNANVVENGDALRAAFEKFVLSISDAKTLINDDLGFLSLPM